MAIGNGGETRESRKNSKTSDNSSGFNSSEQSPRTSTRLLKQADSPPMPISPDHPGTRKRSGAQLGKDCDDGDSYDDTLMAQVRGKSGDSSLNVCICQPDPKIPRPRNAFILYRQHHQTDIIAQNPGLTAPEISKIIGEQWNRQPIDIQNEWKKLADEEKAQHHVRYPEYRYQPRRSNRKGSNAESTPAPSLPANCYKCGGRTTISPTTPTIIIPPLPMLPPLTPSSAALGSNGRHLPSMSSLSLLSPHPFRGTGPYPGTAPTIRQTAIQEQLDRGGDNLTLMSPDAKRRRLNGGAPTATTIRSSVSTPYASHSPSREGFEGFGRTSSISGWPVEATGFTGPPPRPSMTLQQPPRSRSLNLPPLRTAQKSNMSVEATVMSIPYLAKIAILGRISPPLKRPTVPDPTFEIRGAVIAVEGDDQVAVKEAASWLGDFLSRPTELFDVRTAEGPELPEQREIVGIPDYLELLSEWQEKGREIVEHITTRPKVRGGSLDDAENGERTDKARKDFRIPIVLLERYQLFASNAFATRIPIKDSYSPIDHWQWMATIWRGIVGPDITVYIKDVAVDNFAKEQVVEVKEDMRCIVVRKRKTVGAVQGKLDDKELRRVAFELSEFVRGVGQAEEEARKVNG